MARLTIILALLALASAAWASGTSCKSAYGCKQSLGGDDWFCQKCSRNARQGLC
eukprot:m.53962 g.53962  ORF g.53962 m.53962 type:complete len:54 (+) comp6811_c0_seq1:284-445(+)